MLNKLEAKRHPEPRTTFGGDALAADLLSIVESLIGEDAASKRTAAEERRQIYLLHVSTALTVLAVCMNRARMKTDDPKIVESNALAHAHHIGWLSDRSHNLELLPPTAIGRVYEELLNFDIQFDGNRSTWTVVAKEKTRKRGGSFFTPPLLAGVTVERSLKTLVFADLNRQIPRTPQEILHLKIVDPAMGAGFFLLAACDYLTAQLEKSLRHHQCQSPDGESSGVDLRRQILESCIYGVDKDPGAVHAARLSFALAAGLDLESFLDCRHQAGGFDRQARDVVLIDNLKVGDALIGRQPHRNAKDYSGKRELDVECAMKFWPAEQKSKCPKTSETPLSVEQNAIVDELASTFKFFHWPNEFPSVFQRVCPGFDAVVGNPPWEIEKPNSREYFGRFDHRYWELSKQAALIKQRQLCSEHPDLAADWQRYQGDFVLFKNWCKTAFLHQGAGDLNAYKLFAELSYNLARSGGIVSLVVPSGIYSDKGTAKLRQLFLDNCKWLYLSGYSNGQGLFDIHRSFKFCVFAAVKGASTDVIEVNFLRQTVDGESDDEPVLYDGALIKRLSPRWNSIFEFESKREIEILEKIFESTEAFGDAAKGGWNLSYARELDMTIDSNKFHQRDQLEAQGFVGDQYGHWIQGDWKLCRAHNPDRLSKDLLFSRDGNRFIAIEDISSTALPLYEGRMIGQFNSSEKGWVSGKGRRAVWQINSGNAGAQADLLPQYLVCKDELLKHGSSSSCDQAPLLKVGFLAVGSPTNVRSMISACINDFPCGNSVPTLTCASVEEALALTAVMNSFVFDFVLRLRMSGNNLNYFLLEECRMPALDCLLRQPQLIEHIAALSLSHPRFATSRLTMKNQASLDVPGDDRLDAVYRLRKRCLIDAVVAQIYGLSFEDLRYILRDCDGTEGSRTRALAPKGFWRVDRQKPFSERHTILTLDAFAELKRNGLAKFLTDYISAGDSEMPQTPARQTNGHWQVPSVVHASRVRAVSQVRL